jgi:hypothetical protein
VWQAGARTDFAEQHAGLGGSCEHRFRKCEMNGHSEIVGDFLIGEN